MRAVVLVLLACSCKDRFDPTPDATVGPALCHLPFGQWTLSPPTPLDNVNALLMAQFPAQGDRSEFDPVFSDDGRALYFTSDQSGAFQVWAATRPSVTAPFDTVMLLGPDVNAATNSIFGFQPLASLHRAIVSAPFAGTVGGVDFWLGNDTSGSWVWSATSLSTTADDGDARLSADGLTVYFARGDTGETRDIYVATRATIEADFAPAARVPELESALSDSSPLPVDGGIFFVSDRLGAMDDLWYAEAKAGGGFEPPSPLAGLNTTAFDGEPALLPISSGCELVFVSTRSGVYNLYRSYVTAQ